MRSRAISRNGWWRTILAFAVWCAPVVMSADESDRVNSSVFRLAALEDGDDVLKNRASGPGQSLPEFSWLEPDSELSEEPEELELPSVLWRARHRAARQIGQPVSYSAFGGFVPQRRDDGLVFVDGQLLIDNYGRLGGNVGIGRRWYDPARDRILGASLWYDVRNTVQGATFQQMGVSVESLGDRWDLRGNYYAPVSDSEVSTGAQMYGPLFYQDHSLVRQVTGINQAAFQGADGEIARRLGEYNVWAYAGAYHYQRGATQLYGASGGVRGYLTSNVAADITITNDHVFDTNVVVAITWFLPGGVAREAAPRNVEDRLWQPVERNYAVAVASSLSPVGLQTLHAPGGAPLTFAHVDSGAPPAGAGTFNNPYHSLAEVQAGASNGDIVFVHSGSVFNGESIALKPGQQLLGEGVDHFVATQEAGQVRLPAGNGGNILPVISSAPGDAIRLAADTTVSGFTIQSPLGRSIVGQNFTGNVQIDRVRSFNSVGAGIVLENVTGRVAVDRVAVNGAGNQGILVSLTNNALTNATLTNNTVAGTGTPGIGFTNTGPPGTALRVNLNNNESAQGFQLLSGAGTNFDLGGTLGQGNTFVNSDNGNVSANGNTTGGGAPVVNATGNIHIVNPTTIPPP